MLAAGSSPQGLKDNTSKLKWECVKVTKKLETEADWNPNKTPVWTGTVVDGVTTAKVTDPEVSIIDYSKTETADNCFIKEVANYNA